MYSNTRRKTLVSTIILDFFEKINGPRQANLALIAYASSEGSGEPAHPRSLARTFAARSYKQWVKRNLQTESQIPGLLNGWACAVKICHDAMLEDTNSLDGAQMYSFVNALSVVYFVMISLFTDYQQLLFSKLSNLRFIGLKAEFVWQHLTLKQ